MLSHLSYLPKKHTHLLWSARLDSNQWPLPPKGKRSPLTTLSYGPPKKTNASKRTFAYLIFKHIGSFFTNTKSSRSWAFYICKKWRHMLKYQVSKGSFWCFRLLWRSVAQLCYGRAPFFRGRRSLVQIQSDRPKKMSMFWRGVAQLGERQSSLGGLDTRSSKNPLEVTSSSLVLSAKTYLFFLNSRTCPRVFSYLEVLLQSE